MREGLPSAVRTSSLSCISIFSRGINLQRLIPIMINHLDRNLAGSLTFPLRLRKRAAHSGIKHRPSRLIDLRPQSAFQLLVRFIRAREISVPDKEDSPLRPIRHPRLPPTHHLRARQLSQSRRQAPIIAAPLRKAEALVATHPISAFRSQMISPRQLVRGLYSSRPSK
jgi:hypothetical protein